MECKELIKDPLLRRAFHAFWNFDDKLYLHGGINKHNSCEEPSGDVIEINLSSGSVAILRCQNTGPGLSHHKSIIFDRKWVCFIGGWDGRQRTSKVYVLNMETLKWSMLSPDVSSMPPVGLSSHTCTKVGPFEIVISGREGGVRMQRRYGSVYKLTIDVQSMSYQYKELPIHISSRSGHVACLLEKDLSVSLVVHGGRDSDSPEIIGTWPKKQVDFAHNTQELETKVKTYLPSQRVKKQEESVANILIPTKSRSLRHHAAIEAGKLCLVHGGEVFGKARDTVSGDIFVHNNIASKWWMKSYTNSSMKRMGHSIFYQNGYLYIISGIGSNGKTPEDSIVSIAL